MNLSETFDAIIEVLEGCPSDFNQIESYEGQFEDPDNFIIMPPSAFIDVVSGDASKISRNHGVDLVIYLCADSLHSNPQTETMLTMIDNVRASMTQARLAGHAVQYTGFEKIGNFPGFKIYQIKFRVD